MAGILQKLSVEMLSRILSRGVLFFSGLSICSIASADYFQPDDLVPSPRYQGSYAVYFAGTNLSITHLELNFGNGRVNAPTGGGTATSTFTGNEFRMTVYNGSNYASYGGYDNGQLSIQDAGSGQYNMEMLNLNLSGGQLPTGMMFRESTTEASTGKTTFTPVTGGYSVNSYIDMSLEMSLDGGQTWIQGSHPIRVVGETPEPTSMAAIAAGIGAFGIRRRKKLKS